MMVLVMMATMAMRATTTAMMATTTAMIAMANFLELQHGLIFREILLEGGIAYGQGVVRKVRVVHVILLESDIVCSLVLLPHAAVHRELLLEGGTAWDNFVQDTWCI